MMLMRQVADAGIDSAGLDEGDKSIPISIKIGGRGLTIAAIQKCDDDILPIEGFDWLQRQNNAVLENAFDC